MVAYVINHIAYVINDYRLCHKSCRLCQKSSAYVKSPALMSKVLLAYVKSPDALISKSVTNGSKGHRLRRRNGLIQE
jgi:hypothetical protein